MKRTISGLRDFFWRVFHRCRYCGHQEWKPGWRMCHCCLDSMMDAAWEQWGPGGHAVG